jgi:hypothetical protein
MQWVSGTGCLLKPDKLLFYEEKEFTDFEFSLDGVEKLNCCKIEGQEIQLTNSD